MNHELQVTVHFLFCVYYFDMSSFVPRNASNL